MTTYTMNLRRVPFNKIKDGSKIVESRLYDDKRKAITIQDKIIFECTENDENETLETRVVALLVYPDFETMMSEIPFGWFGHENSENAIHEINEFYSIDDQKKYGVLGIRIEKIN